MFVTVVTGIFVRTATTAIDVATIKICSSTIDADIGDTHHTAMDGDGSIMIGVTVLTTTIDRTLNLRTCGGIGGLTNGDIGVINPCQLVLDFTRLTYITS